MTEKSTEQMKKFTKLVENKLTKVNEAETTLESASMSPEMLKDLKDIAREFGKVAQEKDKDRNSDSDDTAKEFRRIAKRIQGLIIGKEADKVAAEKLASIDISDIKDIDSRNIAKGLVGSKLTKVNEAEEEVFDVVDFIEDIKLGLTEYDWPEIEAKVSDLLKRELRQCLANARSAAKAEHATQDNLEEINNAIKDVFRDSVKSLRINLDD